MVRRRTPGSLAALMAIAIGGGCAVVAGLEDKRLLPDVDVDGGASDGGGTDVDATAVAPPEVVLGGLKRPYALALDVTSIYFTEEQGGTVQRLRKGEKAPVVMAVGQNSPRQLLLDAQFVYWRSDNLAGDAGGGNSYPIARLEKVKDKSAMPQTLWREDATRVFPIRGLSLYEPTDGRTENLLFITREGRVQKKPRDRDYQDSDIATNQNTPSVVASDDAFVYWVAEGEYAIRRQKKDPSAPDGGTAPAIETIHTSPDRVFALDLALDDENVFWLDQLGRVFRKKKASDPAPAVRLASSESTGAGSLSLSKDAVYWTNGDRGTVLPKNGTEQSKRVLATAQTQPRGIVADTFDTPQRVYWVTETSLVRLTPCSSERELEPSTALQTLVRALPRVTIPFMLHPRAFRVCTRGQGRQTSASRAM